MACLRLLRIMSSKFRLSLLSLQVVSLLHSAQAPAPLHQTRPEIQHKTARAGEVWRKCRRHLTKVPLFGWQKALHLLMQQLSRKDPELLSWKKQQEWLKSHTSGSICCYYPSRSKNDACVEGLLLRLIASSTAVAISTAPRAIKGRVTNIKSEICQDLVNLDNIFMPSMQCTCQNEGI